MQRIRFKLEYQGYSGFQSSWILSKLLKKYNSKVPKIPDYTCIDKFGNKVAIEYERTIKTKKRYQEIIGQYMDIKERDIIKKVIYFTEKGIAEKLKQMFASIEYIYRSSKTEIWLSTELDYFEFIDV